MVDVLVVCEVVDDVLVVDVLVVDVVDDVLVLDMVDVLVVCEVVDDVLVVDVVDVLVVVCEEVVDLDEVDDVLALDLGLLVLVSDVKSRNGFRICDFLNGFFRWERSFLSLLHLYCLCFMKSFILFFPFSSTYFFALISNRRNPGNGWSFVSKPNAFIDVYTSR